MLGELDWDRYWTFEIFRRACDPLDFRRYKRDSQRALRRMHPGSVRLLDSTLGLGDHTINLAEEGFTVEACDTSTVARRYAAAAIAEAGLEVPVLDLPWEALGEARRGRYDLVFNDALHWVEEPDALLAALRSFHEALRPGGALVWFFSDAREPEPGAGLRLLEWDWEHMVPERVAWEHSRQGRTVTLTIVAERRPEVIDEHHIYLDRSPDAAPKVSTLTMRRIYRWDWAGIAPLLKEAGFRELRSDVVQNEAKGYSFALNRAFK